MWTGNSKFLENRDELTSISITNTNLIKDSLPKNDEKKLNNPPTCFKILKTSFLNMCENTTAHGVGHIFKTSNWIIVIMWSCLVLAGACGAFYCKII